MIVTVAFLNNDLGLFICFFLFFLFLFWLWFSLEVSNMESFQDWSHDSFDFLDERGDGFSFRVEKQDTAKVL